MKLFYLFLRFEWNQFWQRRSKKYALLGFLMLMVYGIYEGRQTALEIKAEQTLLKSEADQRIQDLLSRRFDAESSGPTDLTPSNIGGKVGQRFILKEPSPLASISVGHSRIMHSEHSISLRDTDFSLLNEHDHLQNPLILYLGEIDFAFVIIWLLPLLIILMIYDVLSAEKQWGTLSMLKSESISITKICWLKTVSRFIITIAPILLALMICLLFIPSNNDPITAESILLLCVSIALYAFMWFAMGHLVNLISLNSVLNLGILFSIWMALVLVIPAAIAMFGSHINPVPSRLEMINNIRTETLAIDNDASSLLDAFYFDHPELAPEGTERKMADYVYKNALKRKMIQTAAQPIVDSYYSSILAQSNFMARSESWTPVTAMSALMDDISQNTLNDFISFQQKADEARLHWRQVFEPKIFKDENMSWDELAGLPVYEFRAMAIHERSIWNKIRWLANMNLILILVIIVTGKVRIKSGF